MKLVFLAAAWIAGLLLGMETVVSVPALILFSVAAGILTLIFLSRGFPLWIPLLAAVILMGLIRVEFAQSTPNLKAADKIQPVTIRGLVADDPELSGSGVKFTVSVEYLDRGKGWEEGQGRVQVLAGPPRELVQNREEPYFRYGDRLELRGRLNEPLALGEFDYRAYLASQGVHFTMPYPSDVLLIDEGGGNPALGKIYGLRHKLAQGIDKALPEPQSSLAQVLLLGLRGRMAQDITEEFRATGTSHLLAISGLHVGVVLMMSLGAGAWLMGRRRQLYLLLPLGTIWLYALLAGLSPSVERAAIMGSVYLLALALGRPGSIFPTLALAAGVMAGVEPQVLKQISFQLSFTAVAGIALLTTPGLPFGSQISRLSNGGKGWLRVLLWVVTLSLAVSLAATLATLPLVAFNFHRIPTLGIPATVLALFPLPFLLVTSAISAIAGLIHPQAGEVLGWIAWVPLEYVLKLVHLFSRVPMSTFSVPGFSALLVWVYYGAFAMLLVAPGGPQALWGTLRRLAVIWPRKVAVQGETTAPFRVPVGMPVGMYVVPALCLSALAALLWFYAVTGPDGRLHVHFLNVGQGDSVFLVTPAGRQVLVDGGPGARDAVRAVGRRTAFWDRDLDLVVLTHPDADHFRGLVDVLDRYSVELVLESGALSENPLYLELAKLLEKKDPRRVTGLQGQTIALDDATWLEVLNPPSQPIMGASSKPNNNGVVLRLVYGSVSFLLTADIEAEAEERLLREGLPLQSSVLKVPHHGSNTSTTPRFLSTVNPAAAVISVGAHNSYGHPHPDVTARLASSLGADRTYLTAERGDIEFITDGKRLWVKTER